MKRIVIEAYDDNEGMAGFTGLDQFSAQYAAVERTQVAIESAFDQVIRLQQLRGALLQAKGPVSLPARKMTAIAIEDILKQTGVKTSYQMAAESSVLWKNTALESISSVFHAIIEAIRKAVEWVWNAIKQLFGFANSSRKAAAEVSVLDEAIETSKKMAKGPAIKEHDMPYIEDVELLKKLDTGQGRVINVRTLQENITHLEQFFTLIKTLANTSRICASSLVENFETFKTAVDQASKLESASAASNQVDFLTHRQNFYNTVHSTIDQAITENALPANIGLEQNMIEGTVEKSSNKINMIGSLIDFKSQIDQFKQAPVLGGWKKLFFVLYEGEFENYSAYSVDESELSKMSEGSSRYLLPGDLQAVAESIKKLLHKRTDDMTEIERHFQTVKTITTDLLKNIAAMQARNFDKTLDDNSRVSFSDTQTLLLQLLKRQQLFFSTVFFNSLRQAVISGDALLRYVEYNKKTFSLTTLNQS